MLTKFAIFANLAPEHLQALGKITQEVCLEKGRVLFAPGDPSQGFYVVLEGAVRVYGMSPQGKEITRKSPIRRAPSPWPVRLPIATTALPRP